MTAPRRSNSVQTMSSLSSPRPSLNWFLIIVLGVFALVRPLVRIIASQTGTELPLSSLSL